MHAVPNILGLTCDEYIIDSSRREVSRNDARAIYRSTFRDGGLAQDSETAIRGVITRQLHEHGTIKFTQQVDGPLESESVVLPQRSRTGRKRVSLCVSSQVGCAMGCTFCETAQMGLLQNLTAAQIAGQWHAAQFELDQSISNVVFMGMGEPMDNLDAVIQAIRVLADQNGAAIPPSRITVSTVGRIGGIERLLEFAQSAGFRQLRLAVSLNAPNDEIRSQIMPINRAEPIGALVAAMQAWCRALQQRILVEYVVIPTVNDAAVHADELAELLAELPCTINVIPYNPRRDSPWPAPKEDCVDRFVERLRSAGRFVKRRKTMGRSVMAACGQLGNEHVRNRRFVNVSTAVGTPAH